MLMLHKHQQRTTPRAAPPSLIQPRFSILLQFPQLNRHSIYVPEYLYHQKQFEYIVDAVILWFRLHVADVVSGD